RVCARLASRRRPNISSSTSPKPAKANRSNSVARNVRTLAGCWLVAHARLKSKGIGTMKFGVFYELQLPRPWGEGAEHRLFQDALAQIELADRLGIDHAWAVEHHFLEEYSHCSAPEVFLAAAAGRTKNIRLGHGIRQVIANYNHPARTAEVVSSLDLVSNGRVDFGIGEGATRLELGGFKIPAREKRAMSLEAAEQIANMMVMEPYPGYDGKSFSMPA